jgi:hypothetical protein
MNTESIDKLPLKNKSIICIDCGNSFVFTAEEQKYFFSKGLSEPKRCKPCRELRKRTLVRDTEMQRRFINECLQITEEGENHGK